MRTALGKAWVVASLVGFSTLARAKGATVTVEVDVLGTDTCAAGFLSQLETLDPNVRTAQANERAPRLVVRVARNSRGGEHGRLVIEDVDGTVSRREVEGDTCESVLRALALMSAVAVDPSAPLPNVPVGNPATASGAVPGVAAEGASPTGLSSPVTNQAVAAPQRATAPSKSSQSATPSPPPSAMDSSRKRPPPPVGREASGDHGEAGIDRPPKPVDEGDSLEGIRFSILGGAGVSTGSAPTLVLAVPISVDLTWGRRSALGPLLRAGYVYANSGDDSATGGGAQFVLNTGTFDGCVRIPVGDRFQALPCIHVEGGALSSTGIGVTPSLSDTRPWASLGPLGAVRYRLISVVFAELLAGLRLPLVRDRFYFDSNPNTTVFRPPALAFLGGASLGVTIP